MKPPKSAPSISCASRRNPSPWNWKQILKECIQPSSSPTPRSESKWNRPGLLRCRELLLLIIGCLICALSINVFYLPFEFTMGGISGIAAIIYYLTMGIIPFGTLTFLLNIPLLILGLREIGYRFIWKSLIGTFAFSAAIDLTAPFMKPWVQVLTAPLASGNPPDPLLFAIVGGIIFGVGLGLIFLGGYTTGGTDILAVFVNRKLPTLSLGQIILLIDVVIITGTLLVPHNHQTMHPFLLAMYSFLSLFISTKAIDLVIAGLDFSRTAYIISDHSEEIARAIMQELDRGVTALHGKGMYTSEEKLILLCVLSNRQIAKLRELVSAIDSHAFVIVGEAREVYGEGFKGNKELF